MNAVDFERARNEEMWRIVRERQQRPSHLMDYGDWPPAPTRPALVDWADIRRRAWHLVIMWAIVADIGLTLIAIRGTQPVQMSFPRTDVTATVPPHPATGSSHP